MQNRWRAHGGQESSPTPCHPRLQRQGMGKDSLHCSHPRPRQQSPAGHGGRVTEEGRADREDATLPTASGRGAGSVSGLGWVSLAGDVFLLKTLNLTCQWTRGCWDCALSDRREDTAERSRLPGHCGLAGWRSHSPDVWLPQRGCMAQIPGTELSLPGLPAAQPRPGLRRSPRSAPLSIKEGSHHPFSGLRGLTQIPQPLLSARQTKRI